MNATRIMVAAALAGCEGDTSEDPWVGVWAGVETISTYTGGVETSGVTLEIDALADGRYVAVRDGSSFAVLDVGEGDALTDAAYAITRDGDTLHLTTTVDGSSRMEFDLSRSRGAREVTGSGPDGDWLVEVDGLEDGSDLGVLRDVLADGDGAATGALLQATGLSGGRSSVRTPLRGTWEAPVLTLEVGGEASWPDLWFEVDGEQGRGESVVWAGSAETYPLTAVRVVTTSR